MENSTATAKRSHAKQAEPKKSFIREWGPLILFVLVVLLSRVFLWGSVTVDGPSMDPTLADRQKMVVAKVGGFSRGDVVVANETLAQSKLNDPRSTSGKTIVKRVVGLPGDTLVFKDDTLTINGKPYSQPWLKKYKELFDTKKLAALYEKSLIVSGAKGEALQRDRDSFANWANNAAAFTFESTRNPTANFTVKVPEGQYYLMGDNRVVSADSRIVGSFEKKQITGKVLFRFWPFNKIGTVN